MTFQVFAVWWNRLAKKNGKLKFRNQREAAEFVRSVRNSSGGPNAKVMEMREEYEAVQRAKNAKSEETGSHGYRAPAI